MAHSKLALQQIEGHRKCAFVVLESLKIAVHRSQKIMALMAMGVYSYRASKKLHAVAGGSLGRIALACTAFATSASTFILLGLIGGIKSIGFPYLMTVWTLPVHHRYDVFRHFVRC